MKILVIEDSSTIRFVLKTAIKTMGAEIVELQHGLEALEYFQMGGTCNLIICDVNMPNMSGIELLRSMRKSELGKGIPFLFLTTEQSEELIAEAKALKAQAWLQKPLDPEKIRAAIERCLPKAA